MEIEIPYHYNPRSYQAQLFAARDKGIDRFLEVWHRRSGKDTSFLNLTIREMFKRVGTYWMMYPELKQGRKILWDGISASGFRYRDHFPSELVADINNTDMKITLENSAVFQIVGADKLDKRLVGTNPIGVVLSEYSLMSPASWDFVRPILRENKGWAAFIFTPRGKNHAHDLYQVAKRLSYWHTSLLTVHDTRRDAPGEDGSAVIRPEDIQKDIEEGMDEDLVMQEYFCKWTGYQAGAYFGKALQKAEDEGRIASVPYDPQLPVDTSWDLGIGDKTAIWFIQLYGSQVRLIDYYEAEGEPLAHYVKVLRERPYTYGTHYAPHDIEARDISTGKTRRETAWGLGIPFHVVPRVPDKGDSIDAARNMLSRSWFDRVKCQKGLAALWQYHKKYDPQTRTYSSTPEHDWASDGADAFQTYATAAYDDHLKTYKPRPPLQYGSVIGEIDI